MIRVNLLAADRPTKSSKKRAAAPSAPGAVQAYLLLTVLAGGAVLVCLANPRLYHAFRLPAELTLPLTHPWLRDDSVFSGLFLSPREWTYDTGLGRSVAGLEDNRVDEPTYDATIPSFPRLLAPLV